MQLADKPEFETLLAKLCAGFNAPLTDARIDAYWTGLARMTLAQLARTIEHALAENGPEKLPTVSAMWALHRQARSSAQTIEQAKAPKPEEPDHLEYFANRLMLAHVIGRGGLGSTARFKPGYGVTECEASSELQDCLKAKRVLVDFFIELLHEQDPAATPRGFISRWILALNRIDSPIADSTLKKYRESCEARGADQPFAPSMGRPLHQPGEARAPTRLGFDFQPESRP